MNDFIDYVEFDYYSYANSEYDEEYNHVSGDKSYFNRSYIKCKYCGEENLRWIRQKEKWRLVNKKEEIHNCKDLKDKNMKSEEQRIAIAKACGWNGFNPDNIPDYLNDLNAMHEAEKTLTIEQNYVYWNTLRDLICVDENTGHWCDLKASGHATAAERAEAFLRTLGLWKE